MSPILVRPVREQLEHDRVIRQLQKDLTRRKVEVAINPGAEQNVGLGTGSRKEFPDAILFATDKGRKVLAVIEVETGESVNHLEAMAEWAHYARLKAPFHLYVPMGSVDVARRLAADNNITLAEVFSFHQVGDLVRFASVYRTGPAFRLPDDPPAPPEPAKTEVKSAPPAPAKVVKGAKAHRREAGSGAKPAVAAKPAVVCEAGSGRRSRVARRPQAVGSRPLPHRNPRRWLPGRRRRPLPRRRSSRPSRSRPPASRSRWRRSLSRRRQRRRRAPSASNPCRFCASQRIDAATRTPIFFTPAGAATTRIGRLSCTGSGRRRM